MIYIDGPWHDGRYHRISRDGGETWSEPQHVFTDFEGVNGRPLLLVDGAGQLNLVITWRTKSQVGGTYYARWLGTYWSPMEVIAPETQETGPGAHWTAATVRLGNDVHVLWNTNFSSQAGEIWHTHGVLPGVAAASVLPVPAVPAPKPATGIPAASATPASQKANTAVPQATPGRKALTDLPTSSAAQSDPVLALPVGAASALLLLLTLVALDRWRSRRLSS